MITNNQNHNSPINYIRCNSCEEILNIFPGYSDGDILVYCQECAGNIKSELNKMLAYEKLSKRLCYPCVHESLGCKELFDLKKKETHERYCKYRNFVCDFTCGFVNDFKSIVLHYNTAHQFANLECFAVKSGHQLLVFQISSDTFLLSTYLKEGELQYKLKYVGWRDKKFTCRFSYCGNWSEVFDVDYYHDECNLKIVQTLPIDILCCKMNITEDTVRSLVKFKMPMKKLTCPVCLDVLVSPIWQCKQGHSVCGKCIRSPRCSLCRSETNTTRNRQLEKFIKEIGFERNCMHSNCHHVTNIVDLQNHQLECSYRPSTCPFCNDRHGQFCDLPRHIQDYHSEMIIAPSQVFNVETSKTHIIRHSNNYFKVEIKALLRDLHISVKFIGYVDDAENFFYTADISLKMSEQERCFQLKKICTHLENSDNDTLIIPVDWKQMTVKCALNISDS